MGKPVGFIIMGGNDYWDDSLGELTDDPEEAASFFTRADAEEALQEARLELGSHDLEVVEFRGLLSDDEDEDEDLQKFVDEFFLPEEEDPEELARREAREQRQAERAIRAAEGEFDPE